MGFYRYSELKLYWWGDGCSLEFDPEISFESSKRDPTQDQDMVDPERITFSPHEDALSTLSIITEFPADPAHLLG